jgi:hypothetical protein
MAGHGTGYGTGLPNDFDYTDEETAWAVKMHEVDTPVLKAHNQTVRDYAELCNLPDGAIFTTRFGDPVRMSTYFRNPKTSFVKSSYPMTVWATPVSVEDKEPLETRD